MTIDCFVVGIKQRATCTGLITSLGPVALITAGHHSRAGPTSRARNAVSDLPQVVATRADK